MIIIAAHLQFFGISSAFEAPNDLETLIVLQFMESGAGSGQPVVGEVRLEIGFNRSR
jgi:hypothetical protein